MADPLLMDFDTPPLLADPYMDTDLVVEARAKDSRWKRSRTRHEQPAVGWCEWATALEKRWRPNMILLASTALCLSDQYLDGGVLHALCTNSFPRTALVLALSVVVPQLMSLLFLRVDLREFPRVFAGPLVSIVVLGGAWLGWALGLRRLPTQLRSAACFLVVFSIEPYIHLRDAWPTGKEKEESKWLGFAEGLIEAPMSAVLTLYHAMLLSSVDAQTNTATDMAVFYVSFCCSIASITFSSTKLHFYGMNVQWASYEFVTVALLQKFPSIVAQVLGYTFFAYMTRPHADSREELQQSNSGFLVFVFLAQEMAANFVMLWALSPRIDTSVALMLAATMVVAGPPGFLPALDRARFPHAVQHLVALAVMGTMATRYAQPEISLLDSYRVLAVVFVICVPWAFVAALFPLGTTEHAMLPASKKLDLAISEQNRVVARVLINVESINVKPGVVMSSREITRRNFVKTGVEEEYEQYVGMAECGGLLYFCPSCAKQILRLDPATNRVDFIGQAFEGEHKWSGVIEHEGSLYFCPCGQSHIMVLNPQNDKRDMIPVKAEGTWSGLALCGDQIYFCPSHSDNIMVLDPKTGSVDQIPTELEGTFKFNGVVAFRGRLYFCPDNQDDILVFDPNAAPDKRVSRISSGVTAIEEKWCGVAEYKGALYFCPCSADSIMVLEPDAGNRVSHIYHNETGEALWQGVVEREGLLYFAPCTSPKVMVLEPVSKTLAFLDTEALALVDEGVNYKWNGLAKLKDRLYFCPYLTNTIMVLDKELMPISRDYFCRTDDNADACSCYCCSQAHRENAAITSL